MAPLELVLHTRGSLPVASRIIELGHGVDHVWVRSIRLHAAQNSPIPR